MLGAFIKLLVVFLTVYLLSISPVLYFLFSVLAFQPAYVTINHLIAMYQKKTQINELFLTGSFLFGCNIIGTSLQFSSINVVLALIWSYARNLDQNFSMSMKKLNIKFDCYSSMIAGCACIFYTAGAIMIKVPIQTMELHEYFENMLRYILVTFLVFIIPMRLGNRLGKESSLLTSYIIMFLISILALGQPAVLIIQLIISKTSLFLYSSQKQEDLPTGLQKAGVISHILSHKDSRRIFLFLV